ncbi:hypothetical protein, partial [Bacillus sp. AFS040349]|uniref:hypothetical protein n=1 Tax=Bacillus sp. AFS040349 TaxID=2033502 RepID=UPI001C3F3699
MATERETPHTTGGLFDKSSLCYFSIEKASGATSLIWRIKMKELRKYQTFASVEEMDVNVKLT